MQGKGRGKGICLTLVVGLLQSWMGVSFIEGKNATGSLAGVSGNIRLCLIKQIKQRSFKLERENEFEAGFHLSELKS